MTQMIIQLIDLSSLMNNINNREKSVLGLTMTEE